ncbi:translocation/assembly module TamB domain-containing protein [Oculatella sp. FACHB-28]|uniref:translocation/assembly module TamB domain-containing protein n=1 Tax=Oculatella sp. FACHB-28 TaxID=2692845 RepID=UPI001687C879|nr:translocation/assembly module TamB domain-containing protein [Oculatella sp. FACHB-28]MBD2058278.1 translocation/assembly module TamB domain-containing protein [Oculatella sp. FACHB-28]
MTNSPNSGHEPEPTPQPTPEPTPPRRNRRLRRFLFRTTLLFSSIAVVGGAVGAWWVWIFIQERLSPLVEQNLTQTLNRPVDLGEVESVSFNGIRFGPSSMPPTETDADQISVEAVDVGFSLLPVLLDRRLGLNITLIRPDVYVDSAPDGRWIGTQIRTQEGEGGLKTELETIRWQNAKLVLAPEPEIVEPEIEEEVEAAEGSDNDAATRDTARDEQAAEEAVTTPTLVTVENLNGVASFYDNNDRIAYELTGQIASGGTLQLDGETLVPDQATNLVVQGQELLATDVGALLPLPLRFRAGRLGGNLKVQFRADQPIELFGAARFRDVTMEIPGVPNQFSEADGGLRFEGQRVALEDIETLYGQIPARVGGSLHTQEGYDITAQVESASAKDVLETFDLEFPIATSGNFRADLNLVGPIDKPQLNGVAVNRTVARVDRVDLSAVRAEFSVTPQALTFTQIQATPADGGSVSGNGEIAFGDNGGLVFDFEGRDLPGDALARSYGATSSNFTVGTVGADVQVFGPLGDFQVVIDWRAPGATYPGQGEILYAGGGLQFRDTVLQVAGGTVTGTGSVSEGRWQAAVRGAGIRLSQFSDQLQGLFSGNLTLSGSLDALNPAGVRAEGQVNFSEGLGPLNRPITSAIAWNGERLQIRQATGPGFSANGFIAARLQGAGAPAVSNIDLNVQLQDYNLAALPVQTPQNIQVAGLADFAGRITGTPAALNVVGRTGLNNFVLNGVAFDPVLSGDVRYAGGQGLRLDLRGNQDRIAVALDGNNRPISFFVQRDQAIAQGRREGDRLLANLERFPLEILNLTPAATVGLGEVGGELTGNLDINLNTYATVGEVAIARPALGYLRADSFAGRIHYANGVASLTGGELLRGGSRYLITGNVDQNAGSQFEGQIIADQGTVQDILETLQIFELADFSRGIAPPTYGNASAVAPIPISVPDEPLITQLRRFSEIVALRDQQIEQREEASILPDLSELEGTFTAELNLSGSPQTGVALDFNLLGEGWTWENYDIDRVIVDGTFAEGVLTLLPLRLESDEALLAFSGQVGGEQQSGQLRAENIPVEALRDLFEVPVDVEGGLDATATLAGSLGNPQVLGEFSLNNGSINDTPVQEARTVFGYNDARLNFDGRVVVSEPEPLTIAGSIPYALPFMDVESDDKSIRLDVDVRDEGLALLNLFTDQVAWEGGEGFVSLEVDGTLKEPIATGIAEFDGATFSARALPDPLTDVRGRVEFNGSRIQVASLQGQLSNGQVTAQGIIPIFNPFDTELIPGTTTPANPLVVTLDQLALNFKGLYNGGVDGQVTVRGSAIAPVIGGEIRLANGRVSLAGSGEDAAAPPVVTEEPAEEGFTSPPRLDDLRIVLGDRLLITREPLLNFVATGELNIDGTLDDLRPDGTINLRSGQVNLFTTQFNLARGYEQTATFEPSRGLDPFLDVRLVASVPEVTRTPITTTSPFVSSEIADTSSVTTFGAVETVQIEASVVGPASQLFDNLELTSSPSRSENEIIALIGGGFVDTLGRGDTTLAIANLAGSALLTNVQNLVSDALGLSDFRLFPTTLTSEENESTFGLAAELGVNITGDLSASVLRILTAQEPTQFGLRYRLSDEFLLRGSTNLDDDSRVILEYETRF